VKKPPAKKESAKTSNMKPDCLVGQKFSFVRDGQTYAGQVEAKISLNHYFIRVDGYGYVTSLSQMPKMGFIFQPKNK
jgi:hypothetical protein